MNKVLFICLGNICRSATAEEIFRCKAIEAGFKDRFKIDSAGLIDYHKGELPDERMRYHAAKRGYILTHRSRPVTQHDFTEFDHILYMDDQNEQRLNKLAPSKEAITKIDRITRYCTQHNVSAVPDPYYGGEEGFEQVINLLEDACTGLLEHLTKNE